MPRGRHGTESKESRDAHHMSAIVWISRYPLTCHLDLLSYPAQSLTSVDLCTPRRPARCASERGALLRVTNAEQTIGEQRKTAHTKAACPGVQGPSFHFFFIFFWIFEASYLRAPLLTPMMVVLLASFLAKLINLEFLSETWAV